MRYVFHCFNIVSLDWPGQCAVTACFKYIFDIAHHKLTCGSYRLSPCKAAVLQKSVTHVKNSNHLIAQNARRCMVFCLFSTIDATYLISNRTKQPGYCFNRSILPFHCENALFNCSYDENLLLNGNIG